MKWEILGAGFLHNEKTAAIQAVYEAPQLSFCTITNSSSDGISFIAPATLIRFNNNTVKNNLGAGLAVTILSGVSNEQESNSFVSLTENTIPYSTFGMLSMCDTQKIITVQDRVVVYYKYSSSQQQQTRLCTKLFRAAIRGKRLSVRFLQLNLQYNPYGKDAIELYNGELFNTTELIAIILPPDPSAILEQQMRQRSDPSNLNIAGISSYQLTPEQQLQLQWQTLQYQSQWYFDSSMGFHLRSGYVVNQTAAGKRRFVTSSSYDSFGFHIFASPGKPTLGFIAEIVTLPVSLTAYPEIGNEVFHQIRQNLFANNLGGAVMYLQVGEVNPSVEILYNMFEWNGIGLLNISSPPVLNLFMQNMRRLTISNNYLGYNKGISPPPPPLLFSI